MAYWEDGHNPAVIFCLRAKLGALPLQRNGTLEVIARIVCSGTTAYYTVGPG